MTAQENAFYAAQAEAYRRLGPCYIGDIPRGYRVVARLEKIEGGPVVPQEIHSDKIAVVR